MMLSCRRGAAWLLISAALAGGAWAQAREGARVDLRIEEQNALVRADLHTDLDGLLLGMAGTPDLLARLSAMERLRRAGSEATAEAVDALVDFFRRRVRLRFDGQSQNLVVTFPARRELHGELLTLGTFVRFEAEIPEAARELTFFASRALRSVDLEVVGDGLALRFALEPGERSPPIPLPGRAGAVGPAG
jgi:hypothetical protein